MTADEQTVETTSTARILETEDSVIVWIDGPFETRSVKIPTTDAHTFSGFSKKLDCRAIIYRCDRGGGRLRVLYPADTGREVVIRYDLSDFDDYNYDDEATVASIRHCKDPMTDDEIEKRWTILWESAGEDDE